MDVLVLIDKLDELVATAKNVPMTDQVRIDREELFEIIDQMRSTIPEEIKQARWIVKGLRAVSDFEWEFQMNHLNRGLGPEIETLYMMSSPKYSFLSSRGVREIASFGGPVAEYVPEQVARRLAEMHAAGDT